MQKQVNSIDIRRIEAYKSLWQTDKRFVRLQGGAGSGKSIAVAQYLLITAMSEPGHRIFAFRKVGRTVKNSIFATFKDLISDYDLVGLFKVNNTDRTFTCIETGSEIICAGLDDPEKIKSIKDPTLIWMEECTEFNYPDFEQLNLRLRKEGIKNQLILSYNPISTENWVYKRFELKQELAGKELFIKSTYKDNPFLPDAYIEALQRLSATNEAAYKVYAEGNWANLTQGKIYPDFEIIPEFPSELLERSIYGLDFGFNDPMALVRVARKDYELYIDQLVYQSGITTGELALKMKALGITSNDIIYADAASPGSIQQLNNAGFKGCKASKKGPGSILSGIDKVKEHSLFVTNNSVDVIKELNKYCWVEDKAGGFLEKPTDAFNHSLDALRYAVYSSTYDAPRRAKGFSKRSFNRGRRRR